MELTQLKQFIKVAEYESLSEAAAVLHISQPALSAMVKRLEAELGVMLFERKKNAIKLNEMGRNALVYAQAVVAKAEEMKAYFLEQADDFCHIKFGFCDAGIMWFLLPKFSLLPEQYSVKTSRFEFLKKGQAELCSGQYDVVISSQKFDDECDGNAIASHFLLTDRALLSVPKNHPLAKHTSLSLEDILPYKVLQLNVQGHFWGKISQYLAKHLPSLFIDYEDDFMTFQQRLIESDFLSFSSQLAQTYRDDGDGRLLIPLKDEVCQIDYFLNFLTVKEKRLKKLLDLIL
ncbi:LysR family transcriptional regulator [Avibacterium sp. 20-126]|uniref:LysR family transcriptional regulator n=1 Tax=Avibacterium sp. 20-126 TaxID=2911524 RepID=UPI0021861F8E|nr:LysR family transcriptional regulator [Avibacterium sp. 20-126]